MVFQELKHHLKEADGHVKSYLDHSEEYFKLKVFKIYMGVVTMVAKSLIIGFVVLLASILLSIAASYWIGDVLDNDIMGFLLVGLFYVFLAIFLYVFRERLTVPLLKKCSEFYFDDL
ncbi:hypothetical protein [Sediminicola arcticus]|jgi:uncharacterized BrkB/YihY/UPF0761 family membrane protein|uniref:Competence protein n=1 Tax=Sediminicola arcticus TaxID=1574308 RepID=A0ABV2SRZ4_9FLAO